MGNALGNALVAGGGPGSEFLAIDGGNALEAIHLAIADTNARQLVADVFFFRRGRREAQCKV